MDKIVVVKISAGLHYDFNISRHIYPDFKCILGCQIFVINVILGGHNGYFLG
jgi:hypothetical protein